MKVADKKMYEDVIARYDGKCALCGSPYIQLHHVFYGPYRKNATKYGMVIPLCKYHHDWVHKTNYLGFKKMYQEEFEKKHTREEFIKLFGRSYL